MSIDTFKANQSVEGMSVSISIACVHPYYMQAKVCYPSTSDGVLRKYTKAVECHLRQLSAYAYSV